MEQDHTEKRQISQISQISAKYDTCEQSAQCTDSQNSERIFNNHNMAAIANDFQSNCAQNNGIKNKVSTNQAILRKKKGHGKCSKPGHNQQIILFCQEKKCILMANQHPEQQIIKCCWKCYLQEHYQHHYLSWEIKEQQQFGEQIQEVKKNISDKFLKQKVDDMQNVRKECYQKVKQLAKKLDLSQNSKESIFKYEKSLQIEIICLMINIMKLDQYKDTLNQDLLGKQLFEYLKQFQIKIKGEKLMNVMNFLMQENLSKVEQIRNQLSKKIDEITQTVPYFKQIRNEKWIKLLDYVYTQFQQRDIQQISSEIEEHQKVCNLKPDPQKTVEKQNQSNIPDIQTLEKEFSELYYRANQETNNRLREYRNRIQSSFSKIIKFLEKILDDTYQSMFAPQIIYQLASQVTTMDTNDIIVEYSQSKDNKALNFVQKIVLLKDVQTNQLKSQTFVQFYKASVDQTYKKMNQILIHVNQFIQNICRSYAPLRLQTKDLIIRYKPIKLIHLCNLKSKRLQKKIFRAINRKQKEVEEVIIQNEYWNNIFKSLKSTSSQNCIYNPNIYPYICFQIRGLKRFSASYKIKLQLQQLKKVLNYSTVMKKLEQIRFQMFPEILYQQKVQEEMFQATKLFDLMNKKQFQCQYFSSMYDCFKFYQSLIQLAQFNHRGEFQVPSFNTQRIEEVMILPRFRYLCVAPIQDERLIIHLAKYKQLNHLVLGGFNKQTKIKEKLAEALINQKQIIKLAINNISNFQEQLKLIKKHSPFLQQLFICKSIISREMLQQLQKYNKLTKLLIHSSEIREFVWDFQRLEYLALNDVLKIDYVGGISKLKNLKVLNIGGHFTQKPFNRQRWVSDKLMTQIGSLKRLQFLNISNSAVTSEGAKHIHFLTKLETLICGNNKIDIAVINSEIKQMRRLRKLSIVGLELYNKSVFDSFQDVLSSILTMNITHLDIRKCPKVSKECLLSSKTLRCLKIDDGYLPDAQLKELHKHLRNNNQYYSICSKTEYFYTKETDEINKKVQSQQTVLTVQSQQTKKVTKDQLNMLKSFASSNLFENSQEDD